VRNGTRVAAAASRRSSRPLNGVQKWKCVRPRCSPTGCLSLSGLTSDVSAPSPSFPSYYFLFIPYNDLPDSQYAAADLVLVFALSLLVSHSPALLSSKFPSPSRSFSIQLFFGSYLSDLLFLFCHSFEAKGYPYFFYLHPLSVQRVFSEVKDDAVSVSGSQLILACCWSYSSSLEFFIHSKKSDAKSSQVPIEAFSRPVIPPVIANTPAPASLPEVPSVEDFRTSVIFSECVLHLLSAFLTPSKP